MTPQELLSFITDGLDETNANAVRSALAGKVESKAGALKQASEYQAIADREAQLRAAYEGQNGRPGAKQYEEWYANNYAAIQAQQAAITRYKERYGDLDGNPAPQQAAPQYDENKVYEQIVAKLGPQVTNSIVGTGKIVERHVRAKRTNEINWDELTKLATKHNGNIEAAYDEWEGPERVKANQAAEDARVEARVKAELEKQMQANTAKFFPAGADMTPSDSPLSRRSGSDGKPASYNRQAVIAAAMTGNYDGRPS